VISKVLLEVIAGNFNKRLLKKIKKNVDNIKKI